MSIDKKTAHRIIGKVLFFVYLCFVFYFLIVSDWYGRVGKRDAYQYNLVLFREIKRFWNYREQVGVLAMLMNLGGNILVFVPFGFFLCMASPKYNMIKIIGHTALVSFLIESFQLASKVGSFDVDDLLLNTLGGVLGSVLLMLVRAVRRNYGKRR